MTNPVDTIRGLKRREPLVPFWIGTTSGDRYLIEDPDAVAISATEFHYFPPRSGKAVHVRLSHIALVEENSERQV